MTALVVDANIVVAALLRDAGTRKALLSDKSRLYSPAFLRQELRKHAGEFAKKLGTPEAAVETALDELLDAANVEVLGLDAYASFLQQARKLSPDPKDAPYFAAALSLGCPIWSQDAALKRQCKIAVLSTAEVIAGQAKAAGKVI